MNTSPNLILAIEAAISGGSLSIIENGREIDRRIGNSNVSRAEDLLAEVDEMLRDNGRLIADVRIVAVAAGPGSFTGIRIGYATALGLTTGLGIKIASESSLKAMANDHRGHRNLMVAVPAGRETVCYQLFGTFDGVVEISVPQTESETVFLSMIKDQDKNSFLLHGDLFEKAGSHSRAFDFGKNIAGAIGRMCDADRPSQAAPLFISKGR